MNSSALRVVRPALIALLAGVIASALWTTTTASPASATTVPATGNHGGYTDGDGHWHDHAKGKTHKPDCKPTTPSPTPTQPTYTQPPYTTAPTTPVPTETTPTSPATETTPTETTPTETAPTDTTPTESTPTESTPTESTATSPATETTPTEAVASASATAPTTGAPSTPTKDVAAATETADSEQGALPNTGGSNLAWFAGGLALLLGGGVLMVMARRARA